MDPQIDDDHALQARREPAAHAAETAADGAGKAVSSLLVVGLAALFVAFVVLSVAGVFFFRG
jgi:hypothetical protein